MYSDPCTMIDGARKREIYRCARHDQQLGDASPLLRR